MFLIQMNASNQSSQPPKESSIYHRLDDDFQKMTPA